MRVLARVSRMGACSQVFSLRAMVKRKRAQDIELSSGKACLFVLCVYTLLMFRRGDTSPLKTRPTVNSTATMACNLARTRMTHRSVNKTMPKSLERTTVQRRRRRNEWRSSPRL